MRSFCFSLNDARLALTSRQKNEGRRNKGVGEGKKRKRWWWWWWRRMGGKKKKERWKAEEKDVRTAFEFQET
jgi:hypothetical protein